MKSIDHRVMDQERRIPIVPPDAPQPGFGGPYFDGGMRHAVGLRGGFFLVFLVLLLIVAVAALLLSMSQRRRDGGARDGGARDGWPGGSARKILDERLARGEIDVDDYTSRRNVLSGQPQGS